MVPRPRVRAVSCRVGMLSVLLVLAGCQEYEGPALLPGPGEPGYDGALEEKATRYDRQHLLFNCAGHGVNSDVVVATNRPEERALIEAFLQDNSHGWDFEAWSGRQVLDVLSGTEKVAGLYAGVGIAADAYRYGTLRDRGYPAEDVERARGFLLRGIEGLFTAVEITGVDGVIARGFCRRDVPGPCGNEQTMPLFDEHGLPLPPEKNNGTWRQDNSGGGYPDHIWEDSCSRDMLIGWAAAFGATWEVIADDPAFSSEAKGRLQAHASRIGRSLMVKRTGGPGSMGEAFDLEIHDADGRTTFHGYLNENAWDRLYLPWLPIKDGMYALMSLGIVGALTYCSEDPVLEAYLVDHLIGERSLDRIASAHQLGVNLGTQTNFSGVNMALQGALLAQRYIRDPAVRNRVRLATVFHLYPAQPFLPQGQPEAYAYSLFDFTHAVAVSGASAFGPMVTAPDPDAVARGVQTLHDFRAPPYWDEAIINCDETEIATGICVLLDGTQVEVLGEVGRNNDLITREPIPAAVRPPSNYHWRSNPYRPNGGGDGSRMNPGVDFRYAYWYGRFVR